jgi:hypothetical protein
MFMQCERSASRQQASAGQANIFPLHFYPSKKAVAISVAEPQNLCGAGPGKKTETSSIVT